MKSLRMAHGAATLATCVLLGLTASGHWAQLNPMPQSTAGAAAFSDPLCDLANELVELVCRSSTSNGIEGLAYGFIDEVDRVTWGELEPLIANAKAELDAIFDPFDTPSLDPVDAGADADPVDTSFMTTEEMGDELCERAKAARDRICNSIQLADHQDVGTLWHQMRWLLDDLEEQARPVVPVPIAG
ncbi:MAG: hypothetical protein IIA64_06095 [Planctomycetes bacterium]|nr:hypothetical protein [Planctomycetota bacterium]